MISSETKICIGIGFPIYKSLGPVIHNAGLKHAGLSDKFIYISLNVTPEKLEQFLDFAKSSNIHSITVTLPHKEAVIPHLDEVDPIIEKIGAVNTILNQDGKLFGTNTDYIGAFGPLKEITNLEGKKVGLIGAGGAAKAIAYGLIQNGAIVKIYNRTLEKAEQIAKNLECEYGSLDQIGEVANFDIIFNASSVGFSGSSQEDQTPVPREYIKSNQIVFDAVYSPLKTKLIQDAQSVGAQTILGTELLLHQGYAQFEKYFGIEAPREVMKDALMEYLIDEK